MKKLLLVFFIFLNVVYSIDFNDYIYNVSGRIDNTLLVDKKKQKLFVLSENESHEIAVIDTFRVTTGKVLGDKSKEGDNKTPEGIYTLTRKLYGERLPEKYGPMAFVLDYPNYVDHLDKKSGSNIWIHGRNEAIKDRQTEGCISLENSHILDLAKYITLYKTKIIIVDSVDSNIQDADQLKLKLKDFLNSWSYNWSKGNLDEYFNCYSEKFKENGNSFKSFKNRKKQLEKNYKWKQVNADSIYFVISGKEILANFQQTYISPKFVSIGIKTLTIIKEDGDLKIVKEDFRRTSDRLEINKKIEEFLANWEKAWESVDIDQYISFYSDTFSVKEGNRDWFYADKKEKFSRVKKIEVGISSIRAFSNIENQWVVSFRQKYQADNYQDYGQKTMILEQEENGELKIINEVWRAGR